MATYVPHYQHDIFVSYAQVDNEPLAGADTRWVTNLITGLKPLLGQKFGRADAYSLWMDNTIRAYEAITRHLIEQVQDSAILLLVLSPGYVASEWCCRELSTFVAKVGKERTIQIVETYASGGKLSSETKSALLQLITLASDEEPATPVGSQEMLALMVGLDQILG